MTNTHRAEKGVVAAQTSLIAAANALESGDAEKGAELAKRAMDQAEGHPRLVADAAFLAGQALVSAYKHAEAAAHFEVAIPLLEREGSSDEAGVVREWLSAAKMVMALPPDGDAQDAQDAGDGDGGDDVGVDADALLAQAAEALQEGDGEKALINARLGGAMLANNPPGLAAARALEAQALVLTNEPQEAFEVLDRATEEANEAGLMPEVEALDKLRMQLQLHLSMMRASGLSVEEIERMESPMERVVLLLQKAMVCANQDENDAALALVDVALGHAEASEQPRLRIEALLNAAQIHKALGKAAEAKVEIDQALSLAEAHVPEAVPMITTLSEQA